MTTHHTPFTFPASHDGVCPTCGKPILRTQPVSWWGDDIEHAHHHPLKDRPICPRCLHQKPCGCGGEAE